MISLELLKEGASLALITCSTLHNPVEHIDQEPREMICLRLRSGVRFHMVSENKFLTLQLVETRIALCITRLVATSV